MITNGEFVDNMLDRIRDFASMQNIEAQAVIEAIRDDHQGQLGVGYMHTGFIRRELKKISHRVEELFYVMDPMWFVVALYHRNQGGFWRDIQKYGVRKNASSYKVRKASSTN